LARETKKIEEEKEMKNGMKSAVLALREAATQKQILTNLKNKTRLTARAAAPIFGAVLLNLLVHEAARAQSGGPIFSGNANNLANIIREGLKLFAILLFCGGALGVGAAIWNKMWGKEWGNYAIGGGAAFAFGTIVAVIYSISQGQAVAVDTNF
jgi:succinate dehydrogenase/fumarate reductase cytochrome b subunit